MHMFDNDNNQDDLAPLLIRSRHATNLKFVVNLLTHWNPTNLNGQKLK